ncbi:hypothetical protein BDZ89DRAFT_243036 [Hymenopellis radicata]|nr:hypothetical protein BDZ89DRAFT_243036 [Hymenopellis radicata]
MVPTCLLFEICAPPLSLLILCAILRYMFSYLSRYLRMYSKAGMHYGKGEGLAHHRPQCLSAERSFNCAAWEILALPSQFALIIPCSHVHMVPTCLLFEICAPPLSLLILCAILRYMFSYLSRYLRMYSLLVCFRANATCAQQACPFG